MDHRAALVFVAMVACTSTGGLTGGGEDGGPDAAAPEASVADAGIDADADVAPQSKYRAAVLADAPIAYYRFEETIGAEAANEVGGPGAIGPATYLDVTLGEPGALRNERGRAIELKTGRIYVSDPRLAFAGTEAFTVECWVQPKATDAVNRRVFSHEKLSDPREGYNVTVASSVVGISRWAAGEYQSADFAGTLMLGTWTYLVATYDGTELRLYFDAALKAVSVGPTKTMNALDAPFTIGNDSHLNVSGFIGLLDEVAVYNKSLTATQIAAHFQAAQ